MAGYVDLRTIPGVTLSTSPAFNWDFPLPVAGNVSNIPLSILPGGTQLYVVAFDAGSFNTVTPSLSFLNSTQWAVVKDNANLAPALDLQTKSVILSTAVGSTEIIAGTDNITNANNVNLAPIPEPTTFSVGVLMAFAGLGRQRRQRH